MYYERMFGYNKVKHTFGVMGLSYETEIREFVANFMIDQGNPRAVEVSQELPWFRVVNLLWCAKAYYKQGNIFMSLDEIPNPEHGKSYGVWSMGRVDYYSYWDGKFIYSCTTTEDHYKG
nr:hypothetical protein [Mycobacterium sp. E3298]